MNKTVLWIVIVVLAGFGFYIYSDKILDRVIDKAIDRMDHEKIVDKVYDKFKEEYPNFHRISKDLDQRFYRNERP